MVMYGKGEIFVGRPELSFLEIHTYQDVEYDTYNILEYLQLTRGGGKHSALTRAIHISTGPRWPMVRRAAYWRRPDTLAASPLKAHQTF